ncbi:cholesterol esterase [Podila horticola]|nr:cholesterol esterase [Podila horticola]
MIHIPIVSRLSLGDYRSIILTFVILGIETCFRMVAYLIPGLILDGGKALVEKIFPWVVTNHISARAPPLENAANVQEMLRFWNYPVQEHLVRTQDNYLLGVHRITHGRERVSAKGRVPNPPEEIVKLLRENGVPLAAETKEAYMNKKTSKRDQEEDLEADLDANIRENPHPKKGDYIKPVVLLYHGFMMCSEVWLCNLDEERNLAFVLAEAGYDVWLGNTRANKYSLKHMFLKPHEQKFWEFSMDELALFDLPDTVDYILNRTGAPSLVYIGFSQGTAQAFASLSIKPDLNDKISLFIALAPATTPPGLQNGLITSIIKATPNHWFQIIRTQVFQMYDDVQPRVPYLSSIRSHCPHPFPTNQIATPIAIFYGGEDTLVDIQGLLSDLPELVGVWEVPDYEHLDFLWAEGLDKHVYPYILELLESHSFNGHVSTESDKRKAKKRASNGTGTHIREIRTLVRELEGDDHDDDDNEVVSAMNTPNASPLLDRNHTFSSQKSSRQPSRRTSRNFLEA